MELGLGRVSTKSGTTLVADVNEQRQPSVPSIFALASAPGRAGVAVVRVTGPAAGTAIDALAGPRPSPRRASLRTLRATDGGTEIDRGIVLWMPGPATFTGEDTAEFQIHGGPAVVRALLAALGRIPGCRPAEPGEFARRAFANGRVDLTAVEGLADLIDAETEAQRRQALRQSGGALFRLYDGWRERLLRASALVTAAIDFSDEGDVADTAAAEARQVVVDLAADLSRHLADANRGEILREGYRVVLAGPPNVGKSTLLNALAGRDAAIVAPEAGTTRDVIEIRLDIAGIPVIVADTAGLRRPELAGAVEREGMRRTLDHASGADLVLWLNDATQPDLPEPPPAIASRSGTVLKVHTKSDLLSKPTAPQPAAIAVSALTLAGLDQLERRIAELATARTQAEAAGESPVITRLRHRRHLERAGTALQTFLAGDLNALELRAEELRTAADELGRLTGRLDVEAVLDALFSRFCIGK